MKFTAVLILAIACGLIADSLPAAPATAPAPATQPQPQSRPTLADVRRDFAAGLAKLDAIESAPAAAVPFTVYTSDTTPAAIVAAATGGVRSMTQAHVSLYADYPTPRPPGTNMLKVPPGNVRHFARTCVNGGTLTHLPKPLNVVAGSPVVFEFDGREMNEPKNLLVFSEYIRTFKAEAPELKVSCYVTPPWYALLLETWQAGPSKGELAYLESGFAITKPITDQCDFIVGGAYLSAPEAAERDFAAYSAYHAWVRPHFPNKQYWLYLHPHWQYHKAPGWKPADGWGNRTDQVPLDVVTARRALDLAGRYDTAICWPFAGVYADAMKGQ